MNRTDLILQQQRLTDSDVTYLLGLRGENQARLLEHAARIRDAYTGNHVFFRGLIEFSNICAKNCLYCGIRRDNRSVKRYTLSSGEILEAARFAAENRYGSLVLQSGELQSQRFISRVEYLLREIHRTTGGKLRITLSCGEQDRDTYRRWFDSGAHRYLLRIETSNPALYGKLHPADGNHGFHRRLECLYDLQETGYQVGTGVMIGLPFQTPEDLAADLLFMEQFSIDMVGMGPYLEHRETPAYAFRDVLLSREERFRLALNMIAILRILMKDINIAATTALQAIDKMGREKAIRAGANVIMPNITPGEYRRDYLLYQDKPCTGENASDCTSCLEARIALTGNDIAFGEWGDSERYRKKVTSYKLQVTSKK